MNRNNFKTKNIKDLIKKIRIEITKVNQVGLMITWGKTFEKRNYLCFEIPFLIIQIIL
tara:strand:+ start:47 stop:220 length:174 start_codon:yes stop_codon:yes gene_type:complete